MFEAIIQEALTRHDGTLPFDQFMALALYAPGAGYYTSGNVVLGEAGDFITAPEISPLFGATVANHIGQHFNKDYDVLEFGAGSGALALAVLQRLHALERLPNHYYILELSGSLRARQQDVLKAHPALYERCVWLDALPSTPIEGVVIANEVLDAMPVSLFRIGQDGVEEGHVVAEEGNASTLGLQWRPASSNVEKAVHAIGPLPLGYQSELNLNITPWIGSVADMLASGLVLLFDYGFPQATYYHPDRTTGTLMCHYQHRAHPDPLIHVGKQDITAHVDFTAVAEAAAAHGFAIAGFTNQASFLLANGLLELTQSLASEQDKFTANQAIKKLTLPHEMGELFKVMALTKGMSEPLTNFSLLDFRARL